MKGRVIGITAAFFCLCFVIGCAAPGPRVAILNPQPMDQKEAMEKLIPKFCDVVVATNRPGFEGANAICRQVQTGEIKLADMKSSENGRYVVFMFRGKEDADGSKGDHAIMAFYFNPGSEVFRSCNPNGLCDVYIRNGMTQFGRSNIGVNGEPTVRNTGISVKFNEDRSSKYDALFSYRKANEREGNELISIFLSAFPVLYYE
jgi:hypothetical protein